MKKAVSELYILTPIDSAFPFFFFKIFPTHISNRVCEEMDLKDLLFSVLDLGLLSSIVFLIYFISFLLIFRLLFCLYLFGRWAMGGVVKQKSLVGVGSMK